MIPSYYDINLLITLTIFDNVIKKPRRQKFSHGLTSLKAYLRLIEKMERSYIHTHILASDDYCVYGLVCIDLFIFM